MTSSSLVASFWESSGVHDCACAAHRDGLILSLVLEVAFTVAFVGVFPQHQNVIMGLFTTMIIIQTNTFDTVITSGLSGVLRIAIGVNIPDVVPGTN